MLHKHSTSWAISSASIIFVLPHYVDQGSLKLEDLPASAFPLLGLNNVLPHIASPFSSTSVFSQSVLVITFLIKY